MIGFWPENAIKLGVDDLQRGWRLCKLVQDLRQQRTRGTVPGKNECFSSD